MGSLRTDRGRIFEALEDRLRPLDFVDAMWEGGAVSFGRLDPWSDIDLYVVADDARVPDALKAIEETLSRLSPIQQRYVVPHPPESGIAQAFYRLEDAGPFLLVDLAVLKRTAPDKYLEPRIHGPAVVAFDKTGVTQPPPFDAEGFVKQLEVRLARLFARMEMFFPFLEKEIRRGHALDALATYRWLIFDSLVEVLRMKHGPAHYDFRDRYLYPELPPDVVRRLETLAFVGDPGAVAQKASEALEWFRETAAGVDPAEVRAALASSGERGRREAPPRDGRAEGGR